MHALCTDVCLLLPISSSPSPSLLTPCYPLFSPSSRSLPLPFSPFLLISLTPCSPLPSPFSSSHSLPVASSLSSPPHSLFPYPIPPPILLTPCSLLLSSSSHSLSVLSFHPLCVSPTLCFPLPLSPFLLLLFTTCHLFSPPSSATLTSFLPVVKPISAEAKLRLITKPGRNPDIPQALVQLVMGEVAVALGKQQV